MARLTGLVARIAFAGALTASIGAGTDAHATQSNICAMGGGAKLWTVEDDRNVFDFPSLLVRYGQNVTGGQFACIEAGGGVSRLDAPTSSYFGVRNVISGARSDFLQGDSTVNGGVFGGSVTFGGGDLFGFVPSAAPPSFTIGGSYASFSQNNYIGVANPGANNLDIFGTGVDPSGPGFTVPPGPFGDFNDVFNSGYSRDVNRFDVFGQFNVPVLTTPSGLSVAVLARVGYTRMNIDEGQFAEVRNIPLNVFNATDFGVNTVTPGAGFQVVAPINNFFSVHLQAWGGAAFSDVSGTDRFATSGLINVSQQNSFSDSHTGFAGRIGGGFSLNLGGGFGAAMNVSYGTTDSYPTIVRTGQANERSRAEFSDAESLEIFFSTWLRFGK
jgi:hypothetical protein